MFVNFERFPPILRNAFFFFSFFSFLLGITAVIREAENNAYAFFLGGGVGANKVHFGRCASGELLKA